MGWVEVDGDELEEGDEVMSLTSTLQIDDVVVEEITEFFVVLRSRTPCEDGTVSTYRVRRASAITATVRSR